jgi:hypothetical protein
MSMNAVTTLPAGQLAAYDQALAAYREACHVFAHVPGTGGQLRAAESALRAAGRDAETGLVLLPVAAVHFGDERADGARMRAVNGSLLTGEAWVCWSGRSLPYGTESRDYGPADLILIRG